MNSTEIRRTDAAASALALPKVRIDAGNLRLLLALAALVLCWVTLTPFSGAAIANAVPGTVSQGNLLNQLGYSAMAALVAFAMITLVDPRLLQSLFGIGWIVMFGFVALSAVTAADPSSAARAVAFSLLAVLVAASLVVLPARTRDFDTVLAIAGLVVLAVCYAGLVVYPDAAIHQPGETEAQHSGLWRGLFSHKNLAGPVMAAIGFAGVYLIRRKRYVVGTAIALLAFVFLSQTGSKTSTALAPLVIALVLIPPTMGLRTLTAPVAILTMLGAHALTIGTLYVPVFDVILRLYDPETSFTGRLEIWEFSRDYVLQRPWTGFGYDGFWLSAIALGAEQPFDRVWDPRAIVHGHNGYLDVALAMGLPALLLMIWLTVFAPAFDYMRSGTGKTNRLLADLFFMIVVFVVLNAALESAFFRRADPVWLTLVMAVFGLRMTARFAVPDEPATRA